MNIGELRLRLPLEAARFQIEHGGSDLCGGDASFDLVEAILDSTPDRIVDDAEVRGLDNDAGRAF